MRRIGLEFLGDERIHRQHDFTARCLQPGNLDVEILVDGADAGVADAGHGQIRHIRVALPSYSNIGDGTTLL